MPGFWAQSAATKSNAASWAMAALSGDVFELAGTPPVPVAIAPSSALHSSVPVVRHCLLSGNEAWILLIPAGMMIYVNGYAVRTHARLLHDRDSIWWRGISTLYFSAEREARAVPFPGHDLPVLCARCKQEINTDQLAVVCPSCGLFHHEEPAADLKCWTYSEVCAGCDHQTGPEAIFSWSPDCA